MRAFDDADTLGAFAPRWLSDVRPEARRLLFDYLDLPLNAYRHEALVKRLFKLAEARGDDEVMAHFLAAFDRSVRRVRGRRRHYESRVRDSLPQANALADSWRSRGFENVNVWQDGADNITSGATGSSRRSTPRGTPPCRAGRRGRLTISPRGTRRRAATRRSRFPTGCTCSGSLPRRTGARRAPPSRGANSSSASACSPSPRATTSAAAPGVISAGSAASTLTGTCRPSRALALYRDDDVADGLALIDNWGLIHILFHFSSALVSTARGWRVAEGRSLAELEPAPMHAKLWAAAPGRWWTF